MNDENKLTFEDFKNENSLTYWWATDLMKMLGYKGMKSFQKVIDRATSTFVSLNIPHYDNIIAESRELEGSQFQDFKLTRFACYLVVMNGDPKKKEVAEAQAYFVEKTRKFELYIENNQEMERLRIRQEITEGNKMLTSAAKEGGVSNYAIFQNAGYIGMYNMNLWQLEKRRKVKKGKLMDSMGRTELAANLFRITQTEERIKNRQIKGQKNLEQTHHKVGREVRKIVEENTGRTPEQLPQEKKLPEVKKELKKGYKRMGLDDKQN